MELKKLDLCNYDFKKFIKQIKPDTPYLIKIEDRWHVSEISFCGMGARDDIDSSSSWSVHLGSYSGQLGYGKDELLDVNWQEIYEIVDPELRKKKTKGLLKEKPYDDNDDDDQYEEPSEADLEQWASEADSDGPEPLAADLSSDPKVRQKLRRGHKI
jgi:hypothetical protein